MIIDCHAHTWPTQDQEAEWDYKSVQEHMDYRQRLLACWHVPARKRNDDSVVKDAWKILWDENLPGTWEAKPCVNFRFEEGEFRWEKDGNEYGCSVHPWVPLEEIVGAMDKAGVDKAVLQNPMGLNKYIARAVYKYPDRLIGLAHIDVPTAYTQEVIEELNIRISDHKLKGLFYDPAAPSGWDGYDNFHTDKYQPFWKEVLRLGIPVFFSLPEWSYPILSIKKWVEKYPDIPVVFVHGFPPEFLLKDQDVVEISDVVVDIVKNHNVYLEVLPMAHINYTGSKGDEIIRCLYETFGPSRLMWGSELPHTISRYGEVLGYLEDTCDYMSKDDLKLILGGNARAVFRI